MSDVRPLTQLAQLMPFPGDGGDCFPPGGGPDERLPPVGGLQLAPSTVCPPETGGPFRKLALQSLAPGAAQGPQPLPDRNFVVAMTSPTVRRGGRERITVESTIPFPRYDDGTWRTDGQVYNLAQGTPVHGTGARVYTNGASLMLEVGINVHGEYFHQIIYYPDLAKPVPHRYTKSGVGAHFKEFPIDPSYKPEDLIVGFRRS